MENESLSERVKRHVCFGVMRTIATSAALVFAGLISLAILDVKGSYLSKRIDSQEEMDRIMLSEKRKLGIEGRNIEGKLVDKGYKQDGEDMTKFGRGWATEDGDKSTIYLVKNSGNTRDGVRHELYHLAKKDAEPLKSEEINPPFEDFVRRKFGGNASANYWNAYKDFLYMKRYLTKQEVPALVYGATGFDLR